MLDTEFVRTRTLYPCLGLIQLNDGKQVSLIDPTKIDDFSALTDLLTEPSCLKVLHACSEDLETFFTALKVVPSPVFDTQFAAQLCGMGSTVGYANLVEKLLDIQIDKGESRTDWLARPLSDSQLEYAANDVVYLYPVFEHLKQTLSEEQVDIVIDEMAHLALKKISQMPAEFAYLSIKNNWKLRGHSLLALKYLSEWRLTRARKKNMAVNFVLKESTMIQIAMAMPTSKTALAKLATITPQDLRMTGDHVVSIIRQVKDETEADKLSLQPVLRLSELSKYKPMMAKLKTIIDTVCQESGIAKEILASKKQIHQLMKYRWFEIDEYQAQGLKPDLIVGWRAPLFSPHLEHLEW
jgi:ribonuclease D